MTQPKKTISLDSQIEKVMGLLDQLNKAKELGATVRFKNILMKLYETELTNLDNIIIKMEKQNENKDI